MLISYNWLQKFLNFKLDIKELSEILTSIGLEVENIIYYNDIKSDLSNCIVGEIIECYKHPNADKLKITKVKIDNKNILQIICGANNVEIGQKVIVAMVGANLTTFNNEKIKINNSKIRGEDSFGMLCSEAELGISENHNGIKILEKNCIIGEPISNYYKSYSDTIFEIGLTPNRMDAMSHFGVARDLIAYLNYKKQTNLSLNFPEFNFNLNKNNNPISVSITNKQQCKRYSGIYIKNIKIQESPLWLKNYLKSINIKNINNIVDTTNYILHSFGQPLHAFDADKILENKIIVCNLPNETNFLALDKTEKKLTNQDLIICDGKKNPMCIAGVFGGLESGINENTKNIFLEAAVFDAISIRKTSFYHKLRTDAAQKFEKGVDVYNTLNILKIATSMILEIAGGELEGDFIDEITSEIIQKEITCSYTFINKLSGKNYQQNEINNILNSLQFKITKINDDEFNLKIPFHKLDIENKNDIVEEIMRIDGINNIPITPYIKMQVQTNNNTKIQELKEKIAYHLVGNGYNEIFTNSITKSNYFNNDQKNKSIKLLNSLNENLDILTLSQLHNGLEVINYNNNRKQFGLRLFEFNKNYFYINEKYIETPILSLWLNGLKQTKNWNKNTEDFDLFEIKSIINSILNKCNIKAYTFKNIKNDFIDYGQSIFKNDILIVNFGYVNQETLSKFDIIDNVLYAEFMWENIINLKTDDKFIYKEIQKYPSVKRDLSLIVDKNLLFNDIEKTINNLQINILNNFFVFDIFENEKLGINKKSIAITFEFIDNQKTLTDNEIDIYLKKIQTELNNKFFAEIRN